MISSKTIDLSVLSNYKSSTYTNSVGVIQNFSDLRQYIGSEYCLIGGEQNRSPLVEDDGMIKYDNSNSYATTNEWIPIGDLKVTRVTLKYQKPYTSNTSWYKFSIFLSKLSDTNNEVYTSVVVNDTSTQSQTWYEVDVDFNSIEVNYFKINAIVGRVFIKDIVIYYQDDDPKGGGAGSGYIGNSLVSNKKMIGYNVPTSSAEATKTESVNDVSASAVSGKPKSGNGFAKIKFLRDWEGDEEMNYSKSEHLVGTWIDGSNLYEKTYEYKNVAYIQNGQTYDCDLTNIQCIYIHGVVYENDNAYPIGWSGNATLGAFYTSAGKFGIKAGDSFQNADMYLTIRYVKL